MSIRFSVIGLNHNHVFKLTTLLVNAGATLVDVYSADDIRYPEFKQQFPQVNRVESENTILEDDTIQLIVGIPIPNERADLGIRVMQHGKDYLADKPGFTILEQVNRARKVQAETGKKYAVYFSERMASPSTIKAAELVHSEAIGKLVHMVGIGPHRMNPPSRPDWFFKYDLASGILIDLGCHQVDQFLIFTQTDSAEIVASQVGNYGHTQFSEIHDFGDLMMRNDSATGYARVDYLTPAGLGTWGDVRTTLMGTDGYIEIRKNVDVQGREGNNHLFLVNQEGQQYFNCADVHMPFGDQLVHDVLNRTETAIGQEHCFTVFELSIRAEMNATQVTN